MATRNKKKNIGANPNQVATSRKLVDKAASPFANVKRLSAEDRQRLAKLKRGAHQVIPPIAELAIKFGVEAPGLTVDDMLSNIAQAHRLEPLLAAVGAFHQTLKDEYLRLQGDAWKTATTTYGMLLKAGEANRNVLDELEPVRKWFRRRPRGGKPAAKGNAANPAVPGNDQPRGEKDAPPEPATPKVEAPASPAPAQG